MDTKKRLRQAYLWGAESPDNTLRLVPVLPLSLKRIKGFDEYCLKKRQLEKADVWAFEDSYRQTHVG